MPRPVNQNFDNLTGTLGTGSVTFAGITFFSDSTSANISVNGSHQLDYGLSGSGQHVVGYKSADGSNFDPLDPTNPSFGSLAIYGSATFQVLLYRDGVNVAGSTVMVTQPGRIDLSTINETSNNIDEVRFVFTGGNLAIDDLQFGDPVNAAPTILALDNDGVTYAEGGESVFLDFRRNASVTDPDSPDFAGGSLTVAITTGLVASEDALVVKQIGSVVLSDGMNAGSTVSVGGAAVGTIRTGATGAGGQSLVVDFGAGATPASTTTLLRALGYLDSNGTAPATATRYVTTTLTDGDGGSTSADSRVNVVDVNDAPTLTTTSGNPTFQEGASRALPFNHSRASTIETGQFVSSLTLTVSNVADGASELLTVDGTELSLGADATVTTKSGGTATVTRSGATATVAVALPANFTAGKLEDLVDDIAYRDTSENPTASPARVVTLTSLKDTGGTSSGGVDTTSLAIASTIMIVAVNDRPVLDLNGSAAGTGVAAAYTAGHAATALAPAATLADVDSPDLAGGSLTVSLGGTGAAGDVLTLVDHGVAAGQIGVAGTSVTYGAVSIGTVSGGQNGAALVVSLTGAAATPAAVQALVEDVAFSHVAHVGAASSRSALFTVNDGDGTANGGSATATATATLTLMPDAVAHDLGGDGYADLVYQQASSGQVLIAQLQGGHQPVPSAFADAQLGAGFAVVSTASDFSGDGKSDILWRDKASGATVLTFQDGSHQSQASGYTDVQLGLAWSVNAGDFDGDGKADLLYQNTTSGQTIVSLLNGTHQTVPSAFTDAQLGAGFAVAAVADFNGDGKADILYRDKASGATAITFQNGSHQAQASGYTDVQLGLDWTVQAADFTGDGKADLLYRNKASGATIVAALDGTHQPGPSAFTDVQLGNQYEIAQLSDFNGDGRADILFRDVSSGSTFIAFLDGAHQAAPSAYTEVQIDHSWLIV